MAQPSKDKGRKILMIWQVASFALLVSLVSYVVDKFDRSPRCTESEEYVPRRRVGCDD